MAAAAAASQDEEHEDASAAGVTSASLADVMVMRGRSVTCEAAAAAAAAAWGNIYKAAKWARRHLSEWNEETTARSHTHSHRPSRAAKGSRCTQSLLSSHF